MIDFTSASYLGFNHQKGSLHPWNKFTTGVPATMREPRIAKAISNAVANLQGTDQGIIYPSTFHLFWDLFSQPGKRPTCIFYDKKAYPIAKWGLANTCKQKVPFNHLNAADLSRKLKNHPGADFTPIVLTDGWCPQCGRAAPIDRYIQMMRSHNGLVIIDDTQAFGLLGKNPNQLMPYGYGGGGILQWLGIKNQNVLIVCSMAKAFGVPIAVLSGSKNWINYFQKNSLTRMHCSPPSNANLSAAWSALKNNELIGDEKRKRIFQLVSYFRRKIISAGFKIGKNSFPVQHIRFKNGEMAIRLHRQLKAQGIYSVVTKTHKNGIQISFLFRATHTKNEVDKLINKILNHQQINYQQRFLFTP